MSKNKDSANDQQLDDEQLQDEATQEQEVEETEQAETEATPDEEITVSAQEYDRLIRERQELQERVVRQQAEFDNVRRRLRREAEESANRALARFIKPLLTEMDNFEHALRAANPEAFQDFAMGVTMIRENILGIFNGAGIEVIPAEGIFDPSVHEVVAQIEVPDEPKGTITEVHRNGYKLGNQVVRSAQVVVAKPPEGEPAIADQSDDDGGVDEQA